MRQQGFDIDVHGGQGGAQFVCGVGDEGAFPLRALVHTGEQVVDAIDHAAQFLMLGRRLQGSELLRAA